jgi:tetratricopeptide (TPR) repeat protein
VYAPPDERRRCELLLAIGEAKAWANDGTASRARLEDAAGIARRLDATDLLVKAALGVGAIEALKAATSRCQSAPELIREALVKIPADDKISRARLLSRLALHLMSVGSRGEALALTEETVLIAREAGHFETLGEALTARHAVLFGPDCLDERRAIGDELLEIAGKTNNRNFAMRGLALRIAVLFEIGDLAAAEVALEAHERLSEETLDPFERWANLVWRGTRALLTGDFDEARTYSRRAFDVVQNVPGPHTAELYGPVTFAVQSLLIDEARNDSLPDPHIARHYRSRFPELSTWHVVVLAGLTRHGCITDVRRELDAIGAEPFTTFERNGTWLATMSYFAEAIELVGDRRRAAVLYRTLIPYAERNATFSVVGCRGSISHYLGLIAATMDRLDDAVQHFEAAIAMNRRMGARPHVALASYDYARILARLETYDARTRAVDVVEEALAIATELGMSGLAAKCALLAVQLDGCSTAATSPAAEPPSLERAGQLWVLSHAGEQVHLKDAKGFVYIAHLLRQPGHEIHVLDLLGLASGNPEGAATGVPSRCASAAEELLDAKARRAYQRRAADLQKELDAAPAHGDAEPTLRLRKELATLRRELARATGLGGRVRMSSNAERARISVTRTIRLALTRIAEASPVIGGSLARRIRTGTYCVFLREALGEAPDSGRATEPEQAERAPNAGSHAART